MRTSKAVLVLLLASYALADFNQDFEQFLTGKRTIDQQDLDKMYDEFLNEYKDVSIGGTPSSHYVLKDVNRKALFNKSIQEVIEHNSNPNNSYKKGINAFSDMTEEEFRDYYHLVGDNQQCSATQRNAPPATAFEDILKDIPAHWDWRDQNVVTPVKNQGKCGSCWTFSTVGCVEAHFMLKYGQFRNLSEQQLVDCAGDFDNKGCNGGLPSHAFEYLKYAGGITTEDKYPYTAIAADKCALVDGTQVVGISGGAVNISLSEDDLRVQLFKQGPVSVAFQVIDGFKAYTSGVYTTDKCKNGPMDVNHAVLAVGFGTEDGKDYWVIKNSWGDSWGDKGYFKMERGVNMCGIVNCNSYPYDVTDLTAQATFLE